MPAKGTGKGRTRTPLTLLRLRQVLSYHHNTGHLQWLIERRSNGYSQGLVGDLAGSPSSIGYLQVRIDGILYYAHRLAWGIANDIWPILHQIDHVNMVRDDNRLSNLRAATNGENMCNSGPRSNNGSGVKGAYPTPAGTYQSKIAAGGCKIFLGTFATVEEAQAAYNEAGRRLHGKFFKPA